jgi:hypothetical protein
MHLDANVWSSVFPNEEFVSLPAQPAKSSSSFNPILEVLFGHPNHHEISGRMHKTIMCFGETTHL